MKKVRLLLIILIILVSALGCAVRETPVTEPELPPVIPDYERLNDAITAIGEIDVLGYDTAVSIGIVFAGATGASAPVARQYTVQDNSASETALYTKTFADQINGLTGDVERWFYNGYYYLSDGDTKEKTPIIPVGDSGELPPDNGYNELLNSISFENFAAFDETVPIEKTPSGENNAYSLAAPEELASQFNSLINAIAGDYGNSDTPPPVISGTNITFTLDSDYKLVSFNLSIRVTVTSEQYGFHVSVPLIIDALTVFDYRAEFIPPVSEDYIEV
jgi:hypothetical protein